MHTWCVLILDILYTDRVSTILSNIRGCQSSTWSVGQENLQSSNESVKIKNNTKKIKRKETYIFFQHRSSNSCPHSRLNFWSREEGSALPPRVGSPILHARADFDACSRAPFFPAAFRDIYYIIYTI